MSEYERGRRDTFEKVRLYFQQSFMYDEKLTIERFCGFIAKLAATSGTPAPQYKEEFNAVLGQADYNPSCTKLHYVFHPDSKFQVVEKVRVTIAQAAAPGGKGPTPDWCDVCNASQMVVEDGEHICGLTAYEAYSLGWRRGNNASHPLQDKPPAAPRCESFDVEGIMTDYCTLTKGHIGPHRGKHWNWAAQEKPTP